MTEATVRVFHVRSDAEIARARLSADGIRAMIAVDDEGGLNPGFYREYGVRLVVDQVDLEDAFASLGIERIRLPVDLADAMIQHARAMAPIEACGLVLFDDTQPVFVCCLSNTDGSMHRFTIDPAEHHGVLRFGERNGWTIAAAFHSHPRSMAYPSETDRTGGADPEWIHFIVGPVTSRGGALRAFRYESAEVHELSVVLVS